MKKFLTILSDILIFFNPLALFLIAYMCITGNQYWYLSFLLIGLVILNFKFYFKVNSDLFVEDERKWEEFKNTHTKLGTDYYHTETWRNNDTGELIEVEG